VRSVIAFLDAWRNWDTEEVFLLATAGGCKAVVVNER
jgi:hypothetical protein